MAADRPAAATRTTYDVRSVQTGAAVIVDVPQAIAEREAGRLNDEARGIVGHVDGRPTFAGAQRGEPTEYAVVSYQRPDEQRQAEQLERDVEQLRADAGDADDSDRVLEGADHLAEQAQQLRAAAAERDEAIADAEGDS